MKRQDNGNIELILVISWAEIAHEYAHLVDHAVSQAELPGFRKGKAPRPVVEEKLNKNEAYGKAVEKILPDIYVKALKKHDLKPILQPQIRLIKSEIGQDWEFIAITCEAPKIILSPEYQKELVKLDKDKRLEVLDAQISTVIPDILAEAEANYRLSALIENFTKLGLTTETYLASKKISAEDLKANVIRESRRDLKMEFVLETIKSENKLKDRKDALDFLMGLV